MKIISSKLIFGLLVITLVISFVVSDLTDQNQIFRDKFIKKTEINKPEKIMGVRIYQQNKKGEKFLIIADSLQESNSGNNKIILENSLTTINQNGIPTNISAGYAIVSNNYEDFNFSNKVKITKKARKFTLKTQTLIGTLEKGNFYTKDKVNIVSGNTIIKGEGLDLRRNGEYIKIKGKAKLKMLLSNTNVN